MDGSVVFGRKSRKCCECQLNLLYYYYYFTNLKSFQNNNLPMAGERDEEIASLKRALLEHREVDARAKKMREDSQGLNAAFKKSENDLKGRF